MAIVLTVRNPFIFSPFLRFFFFSFLRHRRVNSIIIIAGLLTIPIQFLGIDPSFIDALLDDGARYERDEPRDESPRRDEGQESRRRSASPGAAGSDRYVLPHMAYESTNPSPFYSFLSSFHRPKDDAGSRNGGGGDDDGAVNPGSNLFVTGIHPRLTEDEVSRLFEKYGEVEKCQIMRDPHTKESRGFGFVKMVTSEQADAAKDGLQGEVIDGRSLSIEKARRARPRTPTPGKYFGPPKRGKYPIFFSRLLVKHCIY